jgi:hypothetical protein
VLEIDPDGRLVTWSAGPSDRRVQRGGRWVATPGGRLTVSWDDGGVPAILQVVESTPEVLRLQLLRGSIE